MRPEGPDTGSLRPAARRSLNETAQWAQ